MRKVNRPIPVAGPSITAKEIAYVTDAVTNGWYAHAGDYAAAFERAFARHTGRRFAVALPSCTSALHLSLLALGVGPGDEVIVPDATWIASAAPVSYVGATPVFADIDPKTWCLSAGTVSRCISKRTKAIIAVDLYGHMPEWAALLKLARARDIPVIEDAAEAVGSRYKGKPAGSFGVASCFSFHGSKTLTTGEGGMLVTDDERIHRRCLQLRDHGRAPGDTLFRNVEIGYKYRMSAMQAALGLAQLERLDALVKKKRRIFGWYEKHLRALPGVSLNPPHEHVENSYWMSTLVWDERYAISKHALIAALAKQGIATRPFFDPLSSLKAYAALDGAAYRKQNIHAYEIAQHAINLPSALCLTEADIRRVVHALSVILPKGK
ncbi:MAG: DegT/DnrJ/EryC1/StrS family aminotransferase [Alphaproteobacteria bacterium]